MKYNPRFLFPAMGVMIAAAPISRADFLGNDSLASASAKWQAAVESGNGSFEHQNSRLEFLVGSPSSTNRSSYLWLPNEGGSQKSWFVEVETNLNLASIPNNSYFDLGLEITGSSSKAGSCIQSMQRGRFTGFDQSGFVMKKDDVYVSGIQSTAKRATLRVHYDPAYRTLTGSVKTGSKWVYSPPTSIYLWDMSASDTFQVALVAGNTGTSAGGLAVSSGAMYFRNFRAGATSPEIEVKEVPGGRFNDGVSSLNFGNREKGKSSVKTLAVLNEGTEDLKKLKIVIDGPQAKEFSLTKDLESKSMSPGGSERFKITFSPKAGGTRKAMLHVLSNDKNEASFDIQLVGQGKE